jgi:hypothetical protein
MTSKTDAALLVRDALDLIDRMDFVADGDAEDGRLFVVCHDGLEFRVQVEIWER